jgi:thiamine-phosphate pyrophosphorylase
MPTALAERRARLRGLYAITPETDDHDRLLGQVREALDGGARLVQYRAKSLPRRERIRQAEPLLDLCRAKGVPLIINDDLDLAIALAADGIHLGREDVDPRLARERLPRAIIGVSCYDQPARAAAAAQAGADYVGIGSVFASPTKPGAARAGLDAIGLARIAGGLPVAAIGGINPTNAIDAVAAGADMLAVITALFGAGDIATAARALSRPFDRTSDSHVRTQPAAV